MADWNCSYNWMMDNEDGPRACAQVPDPCPKGVAGPCFAISGINSGSFPQEFAAIAALPQNQREPLVQQFYQNHFWNQWYAQMVSDDLCKRVFDFAVNAGSGASVQCLQQAINLIAGPGQTPLKTDGGWGPMTLTAANAANPNALLTAFVAQRAAFYKNIVAKDPTKHQFLNAWLARAQK